MTRRPVTVDPWELVEESVAGDYTIFSVVRRLARHEGDGREGLFSIVKAPDWANIIALTKADEVVLIHQYRHGIEAVTLEIPGGVVDPGEDHLTAAKRELLEETGYAAPIWIELGFVHPNPASHTNGCTTYLALDATVVGPPRLGRNEDIAVELQPLGAVRSLIVERQITHALVVAAFGFLVTIADGWRRPKASQLGVDDNGDTL